MTDNTTDWPALRASAQAATPSADATLLPCPFCGGVAVITTNGSLTHFVRCEACDAESPEVRHTRAEAAADWNTRPSPAVAADTLQAEITVRLRAAYDAGEAASFSAADAMARMLADEQAAHAVAVTHLDEASVKVRSLKHRLVATRELLDSAQLDLPPLLFAELVAALTDEEAGAGDSGTTI